MIQLNFGALMKWTNKNIESAITASSIGFFIILWHFLSRHESIYLPSPYYTLKVLINLIIHGDQLYGRTIQALTLSSLKIVIQGVIISLLFGFVLGILMGYFRKVELFFNTIMEILRPIPPLAWIPLGYILLSFSNRPTVYVQLLVVFVGAFFPILVNTVQGVKNVDRKLIEAAKSCGSNERDVLLKVIIPSSIPSIITGFRIGLGIGWMCIVAAEFVGGRSGIGYYIWSSYSLGGRSAEIIAGMIVIGLVSYVLNKSVLLVEKRLSLWRYT